MADKYNKNGYNSSDFKRNTSQEMASSMNDHDQDGEEGSRLNEKASEYMRELLSEKIKLNSAKFPMSTQLIDAEVTKIQTSGRIPPREYKYVDVYGEKPCKVVVKVLVPIKEHPKINFVGKLLGPKGQRMKTLKEETMCKLAILGRGSMRDRKKEEELRNSLDPKFAHLSDELHVEISALAPPAEAHARIAYALAEVKKYLIPDPSDVMPRPQMRDMERPAPPPPPHLRPSMPRPVAPRMPPAQMRPMPNKKVFSILERARNAMENSYSYDDPYAAPEPPVHRGPPRGAPEPDYYYERGQDSYYDSDSYYKEEEPREYKTAREAARRPGPSQRQYSRPAPYARPK